ncbi:VC0807 family protein [Streptomyces sp. NPDC086787]|uniref:VC0807 family protein n=1 Tax=Streptomyces sp. NPDC086787 TaxID=3365759 RepID=UPI00380E83F2
MSDQTSHPPARKGSAAVLGWLLSIGLNVIAPILIYNQLQAHGYSDFTSVLLSGLGPVLDIAVYLAWHRRADEFAVVSLVFVALTAVISFVGPHDARLLLAKDSFVTGLFGLLCLVTLTAPRPLMFYFGRKFATDGTAAQVAWWNGLWQFEGFRIVQRNLTVVWGVAFIVEAVLRIALVYTLPHSQMVTVNSVLPYVVTGALIFWTISYSKRARSKARTAPTTQAATAQSVAPPA